MQRIKKFLAIFVACLALLLPATALATTAVPWSITNLTDGFIFPNLVNGSAKGILVSASSTFNGNLSVSTLTNGDCVQAGVGGILVSASSACGSGSGSTFGTTSISATSPLIWNTSTANMSIQVANTSQSGYLTSTDWNTFNGKQAAGNYLTALTGDGTASGPGSAAFTLATVNSNIGTFNNVTVNAKGLVTAASNILYDTFAYPFPANATTSALTLGGLTLSNVTGTTQCLHVNSSGVVSGTATDCGSSGGSVTAVTASNPLFSSGGTAPNISTIFSTTSTFGLGNNGFLVTGPTGIPFVAASSTLNLPTSALASQNISQFTNNSGYLTANQTITLSGAVTGSGATSITTVFGTAGANTVLSNATGATAVPTFIATSSLFQNASASVTGLLTSTDWSTFNGKQAAGNYLTALTGDGTASGPGSSALTLATVNTNVGTFTYPSVTVNGKGLVTAISNGTAPTTYTGTAPIFVSGSTIGTSFSTSTFNAFAAENTFTNLFATNASSTNATTTNLALTGAANNCNGTSALTTNSSGVVGCTAQPQGTVTAVSVASANGFAGSSSGGATPALTLTTTITGLLKGNGTAISAASNGTDFSLITANTCGAGTFFNVATAAGVFSCGTPAGTTYTGTFPIQVTGSVISSLFSTTSNSGMTQGFQYVGSGGIFQTAASSSLFGFTPQPAGSYITALTGDGTASGPGSAAFTLATVNSNVGTFNNLTVNAKGLVTAASNVAYDTFAYPFPSNATTSILTLGGLTVSNLGAGTVNSTSGGVLYNTATSSVTNGTGISFSGTPGALVGGSALTITNSGVTSAVAGTGIGVSGATGAVTITNTGVTSIVAGTNVTISGSTGAVTINASGTGGGAAYPFFPSTDGGINTSATTTALEGAAIGLGLDVPVTSWYGIGGQLLAYASTTNNSVVFGLQAGGQQATTSSSSINGETAIGVGALQSLSNGVRNTAVGNFAGNALTTGTQNVAVGGSALTTAVSGGSNAAFGYGALQQYTGSSNSAFGFQALTQNSNGAFNAAFGAGSLSGITTGTQNVAFGYHSFTTANTNSNNNTSIGYLTGPQGTGYAAIQNTLVGSQAGASLIAGGNDNTLIGTYSGANMTSGYGNTLIGLTFNPTSITTGHNNINLGGEVFNVNVAGNNQLNIGNLIYGSLPATTSVFQLPTTGSIGIGSSTPFAKFAIHTNNGDTATTLFAIGSSTQTATSTLFSISNVGDVIHKILNSFSIFDIFGTQDLVLNTASTTGSIFTVAATTSPSLTSPIKLFDVDQYGHLMASSTRATPTVSCSPSGGAIDANANDDVGSFTSGTLSTACTITFASAYAVAPKVFVQTGSTASGVLGVTSVSTTAFTVSIGTAVTGDDIDYFVVQP